MRVGLDVAPLLQTRAGTARWVSGLPGAVSRRGTTWTCPALVGRRRAV